MGTGQPQLLEPHRHYPVQLVAARRITSRIGLAMQMELGLLLIICPVSPSSWILWRCAFRVLDPWTFVIDL